MKILVIGSSSDSHIVLNSPYVSSYHAEILLLDNGDILLEDKGSRNGTFYQDKKLQPNKEVNIKRGENVRFANMPLDWTLVPVPQKMDKKRVKEMRGIGTNFRNKYQLQGEKVSRFHATLKKMADGKWYIQDHSTNGTTVNGTKISKEQDIRIKKGDKIQCAGVAAPNPCDGEGTTINWKKILKFLSVAVGVIALSCGIKYLIAQKSLPFHLKREKVMEDYQIYERYKSSTVLLFAGYYYEVTAGDLDLSDLGLPSEVIMKDGKFCDLSESDTPAMYYFGTGFFVSNDGKLVTNLHIAKPWLFDDTAEKIKDKYKIQLEIISQYSDSPNKAVAAGAFKDEVKVEGKLKVIGLIPNGEDFDLAENFIKCKVLSAGDDTNVDVAILRTVSRNLPDGCSYVDPDSISSDDADIMVGDHVYTLGFPTATGLQDTENEALMAIGHAGDIIQITNAYSFSHDAPSEHGASGSPVFNKYGKLIGIHNKGYENKQGFNYAIKAKYAKELLDALNQ